MRLKAAIPAVVLAGAVAIGASACGSSNSSSDTSSSATTGASSSANTQPLASIASLSGVSTAVKLDSGFAAALTTLKLTPSMYGTGKLTDGSVVFPITGGNVKYYTPNGPVEPYVQGIIHHEGSGLNLTGGGIEVSLRNFDVDPAASKLYGDVYANGKLAAQHAYLFFLDGSTLQPLDTNSSPGNAILTGTKVEISPDAAALLNQTFKTSAVTPNFLVGVATITVKVS